jgi:hypothetical protein
MDHEAVEGETKPVPVTDIALRVLRIMLNARTYAPNGKKAKRRKLDAVDIDGETCLMV